MTRRLNKTVTATVTCDACGITWEEEQQGHNKEGTKDDLCENCKVSYEEWKARRRSELDRLPCKKSEDVYLKNIDKNKSCQKTRTFECGLRQDGSTLTCLCSYKDENGIEHYKVYKGCKLRIELPK